jgi:hypothetical protein
VKVGGIIIDAGDQDSPTLMRVGDVGSSADHSAYPTSVHDIFCRIGGGFPGRASGCVEINSNNVIGDHFWLWRADHGNGVGWTQNVSKNGLVVNGNDVTVLGNFVEHFHEYQTVWNGNGGRNYFYQCEMPYDPDDTWQHDGVSGYAGYKVADTVTSHEAWGIGVYAVFHSGAHVGENAIEAPNVPGSVLFHHMVIMSLGGSQGEIGSVINGVGGPANSGSPGPHRVDEYP